MSAPVEPHIITVTLNPSVDCVLAVDRMQADRKLLSSPPRRYPGGGGLNVARVLRRLGDPVTALWSRGGRNGDRLAALLDAEDVPHEGIAGAEETRENVIVQERDSGLHYRLGVPGPALGNAGRDTWYARLSALDPAPDLIVLSGSLPPDASPGWFGELVTGLPERSRVVVDTKDEALRVALAVGVDVVKPNVAELAALVDRDLDGDAAVRRAARDLVDSGGARAVLVSLGRGGALLATADRSIRIAAPSVRARSKVGAGDSMVGGLVHGMNHGWDLADAAAHAVAAGAAAVMTEGTELCRADEVARQAEAVREETDRQRGA